MISGLATRKCFFELENLLRRDNEDALRQRAGFLVTYSAKTEKTSFDFFGEPQVGGWDSS